MKIRNMLTGIRQEFPLPWQQLNMKHILNPSGNHFGAGFCTQSMSMLNLQETLEVHTSEAAVHQASWQVLELIILMDEETCQVEILEREQSIWKDSMRFVSSNLKLFRLFVTMRP